MKQVMTIGLAVAKRVFQVHGVDAEGVVVLRRQLKRGQVLSFLARLPRCLVGLEACGTSHHWARQLQLLGHEVRLIPPAYAKAYERRNKTDPADAEAICEAVSRPWMRFVPVKSEAEQAIASVHRVRERLIGQRTQVTNMLRGQMAEFGIVVATGAGMSRSWPPGSASLTAFPMCCARFCWSWRGCWPNSTGRSRRSMRGFSPGTATTSAAAIWPPFPASGRSWQTR